MDNELELDFLLDYLADFEIKPEDDLEVLQDGSVLIPIGDLNKLKFTCDLLKIPDINTVTMVQVPLNAVSVNIVKLKAIVKRLFIGLKVYKSFFVYRNLSTIKVYQTSQALFENAGELEDTSYLELL
jgi:hypothetical protein